MFLLLGIGEELRKRREELGLSIYDIENQTKIKASFIEAIEDENFDKIPGRVYVKGFIKNYAKVLGLDHLPYLQKVNQLFQEENIMDEDILANSKPQLVRPVREKSSFGKVLKLLLILLLISGLAFAGFKGFQYFAADSDQIMQTEDPTEPPVETEELDSEKSDDQERPDSEEVSQEPNQVTGPQIGQEEETESKESAKPKKIELEVIMSEGGPGKESCWLQVIVDGKLEFEQTIMAGREALIFRAAESIDLTYGNAAAIEIRINGENQGYLGEPGEVDTKKIRAD